jgi:undecaprenyl-diphosphatase
VRTALMVLLDRARPPVADWAVRAGGHSFPSGHTTSGAIAAGLLAWGLLRLRPDRLVRTLAAACCLVAGAVGCSRVYLGVHWPTDVLGGWLLAGFWLTVTLPLLTYAAGGLSARGRAAGGEGEVRDEDTSGDGGNGDGGNGDDGPPPGGSGQTETP